MQNNKTILLNRLRESTLKYKNSFKVVENICENNENIMGCIAQVNSAIRNLERNENIIVIPEALICAKDSIEMESIQSELRTKYNVNQKDIMGFCGDILSGDLEGYQPYGKSII
jgi:chromosomal replication initiation ATPase DnaA